MAMDDAALTARREAYTIAKSDARSPDDVDYGRVIHCASFRRLQGKTQILNLGDSDFYRTRLTHTLEVAQLAKGLVNQLSMTHRDHPVFPHLPSPTLIQAISLTHDLGHPPFGHGGEVALNYCMRDHGGFEGNGQTLRIVTRLEKMSAAAGLNLSRRALLGALKYPVALTELESPDLRPALLPSVQGRGLLDRPRSAPPKGYFASEADAVAWCLAPLSDSDRTLLTRISPPRPGKHSKSMEKSLDCSIMDLADDLAYGVHDLEDAIILGLVTREQFTQWVPPEACTGVLDYLVKTYGAKVGNNAYDYFLDRLFGDEGRCKQTISRLINYLIPSAEIREEDRFDEPLLRYRVALPDSARQFLDAIQACVAQEVIFSPNVQHLEFKGQTMVLAVFDVLASEPDRFLPRSVYAAYQAQDRDLRVICDHLAAMTDGVLLKTYDRLFSPRMGSIFDRL